MSGLKDIKSRITATESNTKITSAMKMVSASKLKKAVDKMLNIKSFEKKFNDIRDNSLKDMSIKNNPFSKTKNKKNKVLLIPVASNRGLCGPFNANIFKKTLELKSNEFKDYKFDIISISKKVYDSLKRISIKNLHNKEELLNNESYKEIELFSKSIINSFLKGKYCEIIFIYNSFKNASVQIIETESILPLKIDYKTDNNINSDFIFEPSKQQILEKLIPKSITLNIYRILIESIASEHGSRMTAMHKATENAKELQKELQLEYNKIRQASITNQIIEIISGADAV